MNMTRKEFLLGAISLAAVGCAVPEQSEPEGGGQSGNKQVVEGSKADLALVTINLEALFFTRMVDGAEKAAQEANASLSVFNANDDPAAQNTAIENYVQQGVDGIMVVAIDVEGIKPAIQEAADAGIPVVAIDAIVDSPAVGVQVGVDNAQASRDLGRVYNEWASGQDIGSAQTGVVGAVNSFIQIERQDAFEATVKDAGHEIIQAVDGKNQQEEAQRAAETLLTANPDMDAAYATGEPALIGLVAAARSQGATERVTLFGWDLSAQAISGIDDGFVEAVVQQHPDDEGVQAVEAMMKLVNDQQVPGNIDIPITIATRNNVDQFRGLFN